MSGARRRLDARTDRDALDRWAAARGWRLAGAAPDGSRVTWATDDGALVTWVPGPGGRGGCIEGHGHDPESLLAGLDAEPRGAREDEGRAADPPDEDEGPPVDRGASDGGASGDDGRPAGADLPRRLPGRPRVTGVRGRRHVDAIDGGARVVVCDRRGVAIATLDPEAWTALSFADGTRDLDGVALACAAAGVATSAAALRALLARFDRAGALVDGIAPPVPAPPVAPPTTPTDRPLAPLPGYRFTCDGRGECCRFYGSVPFAPDEAATARRFADAAGPAADAPFTPFDGARAGPHDALAVALVEGRCAFLDRGGCALHRRGGAEAKPVPCRLYPLTLVDDGEAVRASVAPECACVFASASAARGAPLLPAAARTLAELDPRAPVMHLPEPVPHPPRRHASRAQYRSWSSALATGLASSRGDAARIAFGLADALERRELDAAGWASWLAEPPSVDAAQAARWLDALRDRARAVVEDPNAFAGASRRSREVAGQLAEALASRELAPLLEARDDPGERFYLRALAHGHRLAVAGRPLADALRDRGARILAARALGEAHSLARVEAAMRNLGLVVEP